MYMQKRQVRSSYPIRLVAKGETMPFACEEIVIMLREFWVITEPVTHSLDLAWRLRDRSMVGEKKGRGGWGVK